ncbi:PREDICTED: beta-glucuronosyltransferase GlcAT14B [Camelina sativa]|uniref:Beta-glucuronosyltransferase GlcAT14B n=1 Tax=Camelina sativa TaxID=90675 RepID=A0ABM0XNF5_CAMSA|nr:PREDICTED: beta-glucuronosyltransferase GlcAT14B [Camelina sativa]
MQYGPEQPRVTLYIILTTAFLSLCFLLSLFSSSHSSSSYTGRREDLRPDPRLFPSSSSKIAADTAPPSIAYLISGSSGDSRRILRLLYATYHPRNRYLLHLDSLAAQSERDGLAVAVQDVPIFRAAKNVDVIGKPDFAYQRGSSPMASTLHGASILLRLSGAWDWFVHLSVDDYPLLTQDELLHIMSYLPKDLNFVNHTSYIGWKESRRLKPVIVDPGLYLVEKTDMFFASQKRELPKAFKLFSGPSFSMLSRSFIEHCVLATDNFPRTLLMYLSNTPDSLSNYFPTILCNSNLFKKTIINNNLLYVASNETVKERYHRLDPKEFTEMVETGAAFASGFRSDDPVLDRIDHELLGRKHGEVVPGGWCLGDSGKNSSSCSVWGDSGILRPGSGSDRLERRIVKLLSNDWFRSHQCISE